MLNVKWIDGQREPKCAPNPAYPKGIIIDLSKATTVTCTAELPYPAPRCGYFLVTCTVCNSTNIITTAGRPDDPRQVIIPCELQKTKQ